MSPTKISQVTVVLEPGSSVSISLIPLVYFTKRDPLFYISIKAFVADQEKQTDGIILLT